MPPAPPMFSITTCWPSGPAMPAARMRPTVSDALPAANGTTMLSGRDGQSSAETVHDETVSAEAAAMMARKRADIILFPDRSVGAFRQTAKRAASGQKKQKACLWCAAYES